MVTVCAPATSVNLGSGFDVFDVAPGRPADIAHVKRADRTTIEVTGVGSQYIPTDPDRNVVGAVAEALDALAHIRIDKDVRPSSGSGSSVTSSAAAAVALNEPYDRGLSREELVPVAVEGGAVISGEAHADDVAPTFLDGFTVAIDEGVTTVSTDIPLVVCLLEIAVSTRDARRVVPNDASIEDMVHTVGRVATFAVGMYRRDADLVGAGVDDRVVTPVRTKLINGYHDVREATLAAGVTGVTVSGTGLSVLGVCQATDRTRVTGAILEAFDETDMTACAYKTRVGRGAEVFES